ncbi:MAG: protein kinase [Planctomycetes bacterium]|nr:protein kinase [Planctomycetota bacterium]
MSEYVLDACVGRGGFGEVWKAHHHVWKDMVVAIKIPRDPEFVRQLRTEAEIQHRLDHPRIVRTLGLDPSSDPPYFATEFIPGGSLRDLLVREGRLPSARALAIIEDVLDALSFAHARGVIHRDIKPENILIDADGRGRLSDFWLGRVVEMATTTLALSGSLKTPTGERLAGSLLYMAPEQKSPGAKVDRRADLYAVGIVLFEALTGETPQGGEAPGDLVAGVPPDVDRLFRRLYARLENRFGEAGEALAMLRRIRGVRREGPSTRGQVDVLDAMRRLGLGQEEFRSLVDEGRFHPIAIDGRALIPAAEVERYETARRIGMPPVTVRKLSPRAAGDRNGGATAMSPAFGSAPRGADPDRVRASMAGRGATAASARGRSAPRSAGAFVRAIASMCDLMFLSAMAGAMAAVVLPIEHALDRMAVAAGGGPGGLTDRELVVLFWSSVFIVHLLYTVVTVGHRGGTWGKRLLGIVVVSEEGTECGYFRAFLRYLGYWFSLAALGLGFLCIPFNRRKRGIHDVIAGTRVVYASSIAPPPATAGGAR